MPCERREFPGFSWSYSRNKKFQKCLRDYYYYHYFASHKGWEFAPPEETRPKLKSILFLKPSLTGGQRPREGCS